MKQLSKEGFIKLALEHPEKCIFDHIEDWPVYVNKGKTVQICCPERPKNNKDSRSM